MATLRELAKHIGAELKGDPECVIRGVASLADATSGEISFLANRKYRNLLTATGASAVIVTPQDAAAVAGNALLIANPHVAFARVAALLYPQKSLSGGVHRSAVIEAPSVIHPDAWIGPQAVVAAGAQIGARCFIGPGCVIGENAVLGDDCYLVANVTVCHGSRIGQRVLLHPGVVIGADGFGLANSQGEWIKVPQVGCVELGDDVEIGANSTIDRGAIHNTVIERGVKLDNLIHVAHNVRIGAHTAIAAGTAIAGSTEIGRHCAIGGAVGIVGHLQITDNVTITAMSYVTQSIDRPGVYSSGMPLEENSKWHRNFVRMKQLDEMARQIKAINKALNLTDADRES